MLTKEMLSIREATLQKEYESNKKRISKEELINDWIQLNLKVSMKIKCSGDKKDVLYRVVHNITPRIPKVYNPGILPKYDIMCSEIKLETRRVYEDKFKPSGITNNFAKNIKEVKINGEWRLMKDLINEK